MSWEDPRSINGERIEVAPSHMNRKVEILIGTSIAPVDLEDARGLIARLEFIVALVENQDIASRLSALEDRVATLEWNK